MVGTSRGRSKLVRRCVTICFTCFALNICMTFFLGRRVEKLLHLSMPAVNIQSKIKREDRSHDGSANHRKQHHTPPREGPCLKRQCIFDEGLALARAFPLRPLKSDWLNTATTTSQQPQLYHHRHDNRPEGRNQQNGFLNYSTKAVSDGRNASSYAYKHFGLLYAKVPKTGSSTAAGVALRMMVYCWMEWMIILSFM